MIQLRSNKLYKYAIHDWKRERERERERESYLQDYEEYESAKGWHKNSPEVPWAPQGY